MIRRVKNFIRNRIWIFLKARWKLRSGLEIIVANDSDWFVYNEIFTNKEYDPAIKLLAGAPKPLVLDLGANVGYFTLKVADELFTKGIQDFRIVAVEASPSNYSALNSRINQPKLKGRARAFLGLAGHRTGSEIVTHSAQHYGHSVGHESNGDEAVVNYLDIESLIDNEERVSFLKCDIEGSEEVFIREYSSLLQRTDHAVFEFHAGDCDVAACRRMLVEHGLQHKGVIKEDPPYQTTVEIFSRA